MEDTFVHIGLRHNMVAKLRSKGISDERVLSAMTAIPRHFFCETVIPEVAYQDNAFSISSGQTISHPFTVALQSQLLDIQKNDKILEIGTGSGYQSAILQKLGAQVFSIERQTNLYVKTTKLLTQLNIPIHTFLGDGNKGLISYAPFDKIVITAAAAIVSMELIQQLKIGGLIVVPMNNGTKQTMVRIKKLSETQFEQTQHGEFEFVPMLEGINY